MYSFLFSITDYEKINLKDKQKAVFYHDNCGPSFGMNDLSISNNANILNESSANIGQIYKFDHGLF